MQLRRIFTWLILCLMLTACTKSSSNNSAGNNMVDHAVPRHEVLDLVCGPDEDCLQPICPDLDHCPLLIALTDPVIFAFVSEISNCEGCNISDFHPEDGIGKCIEYQITEMDSYSEVKIGVSNHCDFRYAIPEQVEISVKIDTSDWRISQVNPDLKYIQDPTYCSTDKDCYCLSGSGVPFIGCSNFFHAPLNWSGYYIGDECGCESNQCIPLE